MSSYCKKCVFGEDGPPEHDNCPVCFQNSEAKWRALRKAVRRDFNNMGMMDGAKTYAKVVLAKMKELDNDE